MNRIARAIRDGRAAHAAERAADGHRFPWWADLLYCVGAGLVVVLWCFAMQDEERT